MLRGDVANSDVHLAPLVIFTHRSTCHHILRLSCSLFLLKASWTDEHTDPSSTECPGPLIPKKSQHLQHDLSSGGCNFFDINMLSTSKITIKGSLMNRTLMFVPPQRSLRRSCNWFFWNVGNRDIPDLGYRGFRRSRRDRGQPKDIDRE